MKLKMLKEIKHISPQHLELEQMVHISQYLPLVSLIQMIHDNQNKNNNLKLMEQLVRLEYIVIIQFNKLKFLFPSLILEKNIILDIIYTQFEN